MLSSLIRNTQFRTSFFDPGEARQLSHLLRPHVVLRVEISPRVVEQIEQLGCLETQTMHLLPVLNFNVGIYLPGCLQRARRGMGAC